MSHGLEVWDANGRKILSADGRITRLIGTWSFNMGANSYTDVVVPGIVDDNTWAAAVTNSSIGVQILNGRVRLYRGFGNQPGVGTLIVFRA